MSRMEESLARWWRAAPLNPTWHAQPSSRVSDDLHMYMRIRYIQLTIYVAYILCSSLYWLAE